MIRSAVLPGFAVLLPLLFNAVPSQGRFSSDLEPSAAQRGANSAAVEQPDETALLQWVIDTATREVEAGAIPTAAETLKLAASKPWWSVTHRAKLQLVQATCLLEASQQARMADDASAASESLAEAAKVIEECALPLAFDLEAASMRLAVHSLRGDSLLAATATAHLGRLDPAFAGQEEVSLVTVARYVIRGVRVLTSMIDCYQYASTAIDHWKANDRMASLDASLHAIIEADSSGRRIKKGAEYGASFVKKLQMKLSRK